MSHILKKSRISESPAIGIGKARPWPDLPQQLILLIKKQSTLMQSITSFRSVTKSWVLSSRKCSNRTSKSQWPQLTQNDGQSSRHDQRQDFSIDFHENYDYDGARFRRILPNTQWPHPWEYFVGCSHGLLVAKGIEQPLHYFLLAPERHMQRLLPIWDKTIPFKFATVSSRVDFCPFKLVLVSPPKQFVVLVLTGISSPSFMFCRIVTPSRTGDGGTGWVRQDVTLVDPYSSSKSRMQFSNAIGFRGKFYALSLQGSLAVIEDFNESQLTITALSKHRAVPSVTCKHFRESLLESCGEILLVYLISQKTFNVVDHVEVYRLYFRTLSWVKMERLGE